MYDWHGGLEPICIWRREREVKDFLLVQLGLGQEMADDLGNLLRLGMVETDDKGGKEEEGKVRE